MEENNRQLQGVRWVLNNMKKIDFAKIKKQIKSIKNTISVVVNVVARFKLREYLTFFIFLFSDFIDKTTH